MMPQKFIIRDINNFMSIKHYVYKITNLINGSIYFGKSNTNANRWSQHLYTASEPEICKNSFSYVHSCINFYGAANFNYEIIEYFNTPQEALIKEAELINKYNTIDKKNGMNLSSGGGEFFTHTEESKKKISDKRKGFKFSEESKLKMSNSHKGQKPVTAMFSIDDIIYIRTTYYNNRLLKIKASIIEEELIEKFQCSSHTIRAIINNLNYKEIIVEKPTLPDGYKACSMCNVVKPYTEFNNQKRSDDGYCERCRNCESKAKSISRHKNSKTN